MHVSRIVVLVSLVVSVVFALGGCGSSISTSLVIHRGSDGSWDYTDDDAEFAERRLGGPVNPALARAVVRNQYGSVKVDPSTQDLRWEWVLTCKGDTKEMAQSFLEQFDLEVNDTGSELGLTFVRPRVQPKKLRGLRSELILSVPAGAGADVENSFGKVEIKGLTGKVKIRNQHGGLDLAHLTTEVDAATSFGRVTATDLEGGVIRNSHGSVTVTDSGAVDVRTSFGKATLTNIRGALVVHNSHGRVTAEKVAGQADITTSFSKLSISDVGGPVKLKNSHGSVICHRGRGGVRAQTSFGRIVVEDSSGSVWCKNSHGNIDLSTQGADDVEATTSFGSMNVDLGGVAAAWIDAHTSFGAITSDIPCAISKQGSTVTAKSGSQPTAPLIKLRNSHGSIRIKN